MPLSEAPSLLLRSLLVLFQNQFQPVHVIGNDVLVPVNEQRRLEKLVGVYLGMFLIDKLLKSLVDVCVLILRENLEASVISDSKALHCD